MSYLPDGLLHLKLGKAVYGRDLLVGIHLGIALVFLEQRRLLLPFLKKTWPVIVCILAFFPLFIAKTSFRDLLIHMKWVVFWMDWMLLGYLACQIAKFGTGARWIVGLGLLMVFADSVIGVYETRTNQFLLPLESSAETAAGEQLGRGQVMEGTVRAQGMQRSVFAFSNMMGLGFVVCAALTATTRSGIARFFFCILSLWFVYVAFGSGGRSSLLGMAPVVAGLVWALYSQKTLIRLFPVAVLVMFLGGVVVCVVGLGEVLSFLSNPFRSMSRAFSMVSVWERDAIWAERFTTMMQHPASWLTGMPSVHALVRTIDPAEFADNTLIYMVYHFGVPLTLLFMGVFYKAVVGEARFNKPSAYLLFAFSLLFVLGEGIARDTLWYFGCMPMFVSLGYLFGKHSEPASPPMHGGARTAPLLHGVAALLFLVGIAGTVSAEQSPGRLLATAPGGAFVEGERVTFKGFPPGGQAWALVDIAGKEISTGQFPADNTPLDLGILPQGYYRLKFGESNSGFAVLPSSIPLQTRFCLDVAGSELVPQAAAWNPFQPSDAIDVLADLSKRAGVGMIRDRIWWPGIHPEKGIFQWGRYPATVGAHASRGIEVMMVFLAAPEWTRAGLMTQPGNLHAMKEFAAAAADKFAGSVTAWEFWNEPDEEFCSDAAWDYASGLKAAHAGFKSAATPPKVLIGSNARHPVPKFFEVAMKNGAGDFFDIYNFHTYSSPGGLVRMIGQKREFLANHQQADKPIWLTEVGWLSPETGRVPGFLPVERRDEHDAKQEMAQARFLVQSMTGAVSRGVERTFFFILAPYNEDEGKRPWGLLRWDWTVKPAYAALAVMNARTAGKKYSGPVAFGSGVAAHLYEAPDGAQTLLAWAESPFPLPLHGATEATKISGIYGNALQFDLSPGGRIQVPLSMEPVWITGVRGLTASGAALHAMPKVTDVGVKPDGSVLLSIRMGEGFKIENRVVALATGEGPTDAVLTVWNLSDAKQKVKLADHSAALRVEGVPDELEVDAGATLEIPLKLKLLESSTLKRELRIAGTCSTGVISPVLVPIRQPGDGLGDETTATAFPYEILDHWKRSASSFMKIRPAGANEGMEFVCWFEEGVEKWIYPQFRFEEMKDAMFGSTAIQFDIKVMEGSATKAFLMAGPEGGQSFQFAYKPAEDWKTVTLVWEDVAPSGFDPGTVEVLKIGMNPATSSIRYRVRNLKIFHARE